MVPMTLTGTPESTVGGNFHWSAALTAASFRSGCPEIAFAEITAPDSSIVSSTTTAPVTWAAFASSGYSGWTRLVADACSTPPDLRITLGSTDGCCCCCSAHTAPPENGLPTIKAVVSALWIARFSEFIFPPDLQPVQVVG